jgi:Flp pilus assembly protein TadG
LIKNEKGQSLVEFVLVIPVFLLLVLFIFDLGRVAYTYTNLHFTVQETVRMGSFGHTDDEMKTYARNHFSAGKSDVLKIAITPASRKSGDRVKVTITYPLVPIMPFAELALKGPIDLTVDSTILVE